MQRIRSSDFMSMVEPSIDELAKKVDSKYTLVILAAKRARELTAANQNNTQKEVSMALKEVSNNTITYERKAK